MMKSKWKIGVLLMACVFCVALIPPLLSGARAGGSKKELSAVLQLQNEQAVLNGNVFPLETAAPYQDTAGVTMAPLKVLANALGAELSWDNAAAQAVLSAGDTTLQLRPGEVTLRDGEQTLDALEAAPVLDNGVLFVPAASVARSMQWQYYEQIDGDGGLLVFYRGAKPLESDLLDGLLGQGKEMLGPSRTQLLGDSLVFRAGSDYVCVNGENRDLTDASGALYAPLEKDGAVYLPVAGVITALGGTAEQRADGAVPFTLDGVQGQCSTDGSVSLNGAPAGDTDASSTWLEDGVLYMTTARAAAVFARNGKEDGTIALLSGFSLETAAGQTAYLCTLGEGLPDKRPDIPAATGYIALTFDDGPTGGADGKTVRLLNGLKERGAHATFFMCGYRIKDFHTHMERYLAEGHELGNHTMDHPGLLSKYEPAYVLDQIVSNSELIESYCGQGPTVFRPVGGDCDDMVKEQAKAAGLPVVNWSVDTEDWKYRDEQRIKNYIVQHAKDGDIVLMHDLRDCTIDGALAAIDVLKQQGYAFVTVSELARIKGVVMEPGVKYTNFRDETVAKLKAEQAA